MDDFSITSNLLLLSGNLPIYCVRTFHPKNTQKSDSNNDFLIAEGTKKTSVRRLFYRIMLQLNFGKFLRS